MIKQLTALVLVVAIANTFLCSFTKQHTCSVGKMEAGVCPVDMGGSEPCYTCSVKDLSQVEVVFENKFSEFVGGDLDGNNEVVPNFFHAFNRRSVLYLRPPPPRGRLNVLYCIYRT